MSGISNIFLSDSSEFLCPTCKKGILHFRDYCRRIVRYEGGDSEWIFIPRHQCDNPQCRRLHRMLPDFLVPFRHYHEEVIMEALDEAMRRFTAMREKEGENLKEDFLKRVDILSGQVEDVAALGPEIVSQYRERLEATVKEALAGAEIDEARIIQEVAIYSDRVNFTEEIVRLQSHFEQFRSILEHAEEPVGRKLDFLIQEMNREVNTTASKANNVRAARLAVDMKSEIEKLREQVQNIE